jgi:hypothetical protein
MSEAPDPQKFASTSSDAPTLLNISFANDPKGSLGAQLVNSDKECSKEMFLPGYAVIGRLLPGETVARKSGVHVGDIIISVNGQGFRRFEPDYKEEDVKYLEGDDTKTELDHKVVPAGAGYDAMLAQIKSIKAADGDPPLVLSLERYGWDARPNSWARFLSARDDNVPAAMQMSQAHEAWRALTFPIDLKYPGLQKILRVKAVSEIDLENMSGDFPPTVYVNYGKLLSMQTAGEITAEDVVAAFVIFTERMLAKAKDPRNPKTCQFIDLSGVGITSGFRVETLKKIYKVFEPNYPETLFKMVMYPVSTIMVRLLSLCLHSSSSSRRRIKKYDSLIVTA